MMAEQLPTPLPPEDALHAFLDGELPSGAEEQLLFDELAQTPELRSELKDAIQIRDAVHRDVLYPSERSEAALMAALGLPTGLQGASGVAAATGASWFASTSSSAMYGLAGVAAGVLLACMFFVQDNVPQLASAQSQTTQPASTSRISGTERLLQKQLSETSTKLEQAQRDLLAASTKVTALQNTLFSRAADIRRLQDQAEQNRTQIQQLLANNQSLIAETSTPVQQQLVAAAQRPPIEITTVTPVASPKLFGIPTTLNTGMLQQLSMSSEDNRNQQATIRLRSIPSGLDASKSTPLSVQNSIATNTAMALTIPVTDNQRVGLEFGIESFRQIYTGIQDNRLTEYDQTPVLFWMGANYRYMVPELELIHGLTPFAETTLGVAFAQGPVGRASVGLQYQPFGPILFTVGVEGSALAYQFQNTWFTSTKVGFTYGISIDLGAFR